MTSMHATFRPPRSRRRPAIVCIPALVAWGALGLYMALTAPDVRHRLALAVMIGGVPLLGAGLSLWGLLDDARHELTFVGGRASIRGILGRSEFDLRDVREARWRSGARGGSLFLRADPARLSISFGRYREEDRDRIVQHLRTALCPEVQSGWELFAYRLATRRLRSPGDKPGPDEVLLRRDRWDRVLGPSLAAAGLAGILAAGITGERISLALPLVPLAAWIVLRLSTPAGGSVARRLFPRGEPETSAFVRFSLLWLLAAIAGVSAHRVIRPRLANPDAVLMAGAAVWSLVLVFEAGLADRRRQRREREAAGCPR